MSNIKTFSIPIQRSLLITGTLLLILPLMILGWLHYRRPPRTDTQEQLFTGINYQRIVRNQPRPVMIHVVTIDLNQANIKPIVTPPRRLKSNQTIARTTSEFVQEFSAQLAINASYFQPFYENTPWDYYPRSGDRVRTLGENISNRQIYGQPSAGWHVICFLEDRRVQIPGTQTCPANTINGVAGSEILVLNNEVRPSTDTRPDQPYSRLAIGVDITGKKLSLVAIDGKQPLYSEGMTRYELAKFMQELNTNAALHLDGGGSTTLAINTPSGPKILNSPIHAKIPTRERPVANHLGFVIRALVLNLQNPNFSQTPKLTGIREWGLGSSRKINPLLDAYRSPVRNAGKAHLILHNLILQSTVNSQLLKCNPADQHQNHPPYLPR